MKKRIFFCRDLSLYLFQKTCRRQNSSFICFNNDQQNLKRIGYLKEIDLRYNNANKKVEIYIDNKKLVTNGQNDFSINNFDLCFLIKMEYLRNRKDANVLKMPITLTVNNLIDFLSLKEKDENRKKDETNSITNNKDNLDITKKKETSHDNISNITVNDSFNFSKLEEATSKKVISEEDISEEDISEEDISEEDISEEVILEQNSSKQQLKQQLNENKKVNCKSKGKSNNNSNSKSNSMYDDEIEKLRYRTKGNEQERVVSSFKKNQNDDSFNASNGIGVKPLEEKNFNKERRLMESKIFENFLNDLVFYTADEYENHIISEKEKYTHDFINLPNSINYVKNYKISNLHEEQKRVYNKYIQIFEDIHNLKLKRAQHFETPTQEDSVNKTILNIIKNMNDSEIFLFFKCTQILNSFIFTYLFLNGYINYLNVYRYCNLEYIYQFYRWGYVFDVNVVKDSGAMLMLSSIFLIYRLLIKK